MADKKIILTKHATERIKERWTRDIDHAIELMKRAKKIDYSISRSIRHFIFGNQYHIVAEEYKKSYHVITVYPI